MSSGSDEPDFDYIAYIDEAGDTGLQRVRPIDPVGGTEWLVLSAAVIRRSNEPKFPAIVREILTDLGVSQRPDLHFRTLSPTRQLRACELLAQAPAVFFAVCSNKKNMRGYDNPRAAKMNNPQWFYNWLCRIIVERVTHFVAGDSMRTHGELRKIKFIYSHRGGHSYSQTKAYKYIIGNQSRAGTAVLQKRTPKWEVMDYRLVESVRHGNSAGLQVADVIASAFYTAADRLDTGPCRPQPAMALAPRVGYERDEKGRKVFADFGLVLQPTPPWVADISEEQREIFRFYGYDFQKKW